MAVIPFDPTSVSPPPGVTRAETPDVPDETSLDASAQEKEAEAQRTAKREAFLDLAFRRWKLVSEAESTLRSEMLADLQFLQPGGQWPKELRENRKLAGEPCLEVDRLTPAVKQVNNQQRQLRPSIQVNPVDSGSDPKTAEVLQGICRHIELASDADVAYDTAGEHQVKTGRGWLRVITEYEDETSFNQVIRIRRVRNPFSVYMDPTGSAADGSDARFAFYVEDLPKDEYIARFGQDKYDEGLHSLESFSGTGNNARVDWMPEGRVRVAEYVYRDDEEMALVEREAGPVRVPVEDVRPGERHRRVSVRRVYWALIDAAHVLDGNEDQTEGRLMPGRYIPFVPVIGDETDIDGVVDYQGVTRRAKDSQRMGNYWKSFITQRIALASKAPVVGYEGQFEGHEVKWSTANRIPYAYLEVKATTSGTGDKLLPLPQRDSSEPPIQAATAALVQNENDLRAVTGWVDVMAREGRQNETSGRAILARQHQAELGNSNFIDNLGRAIRQVGRILVDLIPHIYDTPRVMRILGADDKPKTVMVHAGAQNVPSAPPEGVESIYDLGVGKYDVTISVGPSHQSMRAEAVDSMLQLMQALPQQAPIIAPIVVKNMDWPGALEVSKAIAKTLPPQFQEQEDGSQTIPPQVQQQMAEQGQLIDALTQQLNKLTEERNAKLIELESKERVATMQIQADLIKTEATISAQNAQTLLAEQMAAIRQRLDHMTQIYQSERQAMSQDTPSAPEGAGSEPPSPSAPLAAMPAAPGPFAGDMPAPSPFTGQPPVPEGL